ncbi:hypothetical protein V8C86DRAFT_2568453 [Haematococcus lacustris]
MGFATHHSFLQTTSTAMGRVGQGFTATSASHIAGLHACKRHRSPRLTLCYAADDPGQRARLNALMSQEGVSVKSETKHTPGFSNPTIDWSRFHLQLLFVDRSDTVRARIASGVFDRIAEWNGFGRALYSWSAGLEAPPVIRDSASACTTTSMAPSSSSSSPGGSSSGIRGSKAHAGGTAGDGDPSSDHQLPPSYNVTPCTAAAGVTDLPGQVPGQTSGSADRDHTSAAGEREDQFADAGRQASILRHAAALHIPVRQVARPAEMFEMEDLDRYDLVLCLDRGIRDTILDQLANQSFRTYYEEKVCLLTSFSAYESDRTMLAKGGFALLPAQLCVMLGQGLRASKAVVDIPRPQLSDSDSEAQWEMMVQALILSTAGLVKFLMDAMPENLPHWDPQD